MLCDAMRLRCDFDYITNQIAITYRNGDLPVKILKSCKASHLHLLCNTIGIGAIVNFKINHDK